MASLHSQNVSSAKADVVPFIGFVLIFWAAGWCCTRAYAHGRFGMSFSATPLNFQARDFVGGMIYASALLVFLGLLFMIRGRYRNSYSTVVPLFIAFAGLDISEGIIALIRTDNLMNPTVAVSHFQSFEAYLNDPLRDWIVTFCLGTTLATRLIFWPWLSELKLTMSGMKRLLAGKNGGQED